MRPRSVIHAEQLYLAATGLLLASSVMAWQPLQAIYGLPLAAGVTAFVIGAFLLLILLTTRRGSNAARWLLIVLTGIGALSLLWQIGNGQVALGILGVINTVQVALTIVGGVLLFRPNATTWFARSHAGWEEEA